ncbi:hypothetical protein ACFC6U_35550 [Kitasatospora purpeofusca]|uniref:hypothetical protein n=1 Tax=Kitasatospora purpeofusca TaxID=67352 RepID=UPI0004C12911|nr:hypothetical protein [Kitasatospora purpeofusca]
MKTPDHHEDAPRAADTNHRPSTTTTGAVSRRPRPADKAVTTAGIVVGLLNLGFTLWDRIGSLLQT